MLDAGVRDGAFEMRRGGRPSHAGIPLSLHLALLASFAFSACTELWGKLDDPADPDSPNYQGFPTVGSVDDLTVVSPSSGGTLTGAILTVTPVAGASAYAVRIAASEENLGVTNLYEKSDYTTNVLDISAAPIADAATYYWQARATKDETNWGNWTEAATFATEFSTPAATPTFSPPGGTYASDQSVTISCATSGVPIYYTTNGSTPTTSSTPYTGAISVAGHGTTMTIKAIATAPGYSSSAVGNATYTISYPAAATPTFSPPGGTYTSDQSVTLSCTTSGATIYYTTNGSTPTTSSTLYTGAVTATVSGSGTTIKAISTAPWYSNSEVGIATFIYNYGVGDIGPAGGIVFYDKGSYSDGWRWLEAAPSDQSTGIQWYNGSYVTTGARATHVGSGAANTATIVEIQGSGTYAASICANLSMGGYDDWFLPSKDELNLMYGQKEVIGYLASASYWSSSEVLDRFNAWLQYFGHGAQGYAQKYNTYQVRAIRAF